MAAAIPAVVAVAGGASIGTVLVGMAVSTLASSIISKVTGSPILGQIAGAVAGFGVNSFMSTGTSTATADIAAGAETAAPSGIGASADTSLASGVSGGVGGGAPDIIGASSNGAPVTDLSTIAPSGNLLGSSSGGGGNLAGGSGGLIDSITNGFNGLFGGGSSGGSTGFLSGMGDETKAAMLKLGGDLVGGYSQGKQLEAKQEWAEKQYADQMKKGNYGLTLNQTREDAPSTVQQELAKVGTVTRQDGSPVMQPLPTSTIGTNTTMNNISAINSQMAALQRENGLLRNIINQGAAA